MNAMEHDHATEFVTERQKINKRQKDKKIVKPGTTAVESEEGIPERSPGIYAKACLKWSRFSLSELYEKRL
jgi:hypothetical protein